MREKISLTHFSTSAPPLASFLEAVLKPPVRWFDNFDKFYARPACPMKSKTYFIGVESLEGFAPDKWSFGPSEMILRFHGVKI